MPFHSTRYLNKALKYTSLPKVERRCAYLLNAAGEAYVLNLPANERTKNQELVARNLKLKVGDNYEPVKNFRMFSPKDMMDIRSAIKGFDPIFQGTTQIEDPETGQKIMVPVMAVDNFFYPREN